MTHNPFKAIYFFNYSGIHYKHHLYPKSKLIYLK